MEVVILLLLLLLGVMVEVAESRSIGHGVPRKWDCWMVLMARSLSTAIYRLQSSRTGSLELIMNHEEPYHEHRDQKQHHQQQDERTPIHFDCTNVYLCIIHTDRNKCLKMMRWKLTLPLPPIHHPLPHDNVIACVLLSGALRRRSTIDIIIQLSDYISIY